MKSIGHKAISLIVNNNKIWNFTAKEKTLNAIYEKFKKLKTEKKVKNPVYILTLMSYLKN